MTGLPQERIAVGAVTQVQLEPQMFKRLRTIKSREVGLLQLVRIVEVADQIEMAGRIAEKAEIRCVERIDEIGNKALIFQCRRVLKASAEIRNLECVRITRELRAFRCRRKR